MSLQQYVRQIKPRNESYVNHVDRIQNFINEATLSESSLSGSSRGSGKSKWDTYLVPTWNKDTDYKLFSDGVMVLSDPVTKNVKDHEIHGPHLKGTELKILSTKLEKGFAKVRIGGKQDGWIKVSQIEKPAEESEDEDGPQAFLGIKNSKEFTPEKLDLNGKEFSSATALVQSVSTGMKKLYGGDEFKEIRRYLSAFCEAIGGMPLTEGSQERFSKTYTTNETFEIAKSDVMILSKNFGEVLGALYISKTNKKMKLIGFPSAGNEGLYDFYGKDKKGRKHYYSAKSAGGSSTSMENLNFITKNFKDNKWLKEHMNEMKVVNKLMNKPGSNTAKNILDWFKAEQPNKIKQILSILSKAHKIKSLEKVDLAIWLQELRKDNKKGEKKFIQALEKTYKDVLWDVGKKPKAQSSTLKDIFAADKKDFDGGYIIYPMGSYVVAYMNRDDIKRDSEKPKKEHKFIDALDMLMNFGSYISQINVDMHFPPESTTIKILKFSKNKFRFSYNGGAKYPNNRPIGFKEV